MSDPATLAGEKSLFVLLSTSVTASAAMNLIWPDLPPPANKLFFPSALREPRYPYATHSRNFGRL